MVDSISKTVVSDAMAAAIVGRAQPGRHLTTRSECTDGWFNAVYRLELDDSSTCMLKVAPPPGVKVMRYENDIITSEVEALRLLRERTDLPVPEVLAWDPTCELVASPYFLMEECPGERLDLLRPRLDPESSAAIDERLARFVAVVNSITAPTFGRPEPSARRSESWADAFASLVDDHLADATDAGVDLPLPPAALAALVERHRDALDVVTIPRLVHWDLWDSNVFVDPDGHEVVGVIDFERVLWADPLMEAQFVGKRGSHPVLDAYGTPLLDKDGAVERRRLYDLYLYLVMVIECTYRQYPTDDIETFGRAMLRTVLEEIG